MSKLSFIGEEEEKSIKTYMSLLKTTFPDEKDYVKNHLNQILALLPVIKMLKARVDRELVKHRRKMLQSEELPQKKHGSSKEWEYILEDLIVDHTHMSDLLSGLLDAGTSKVMFGMKLLGKKEYD